MLCLQANDILFIIVISFYLGRLYERNRNPSAVMPVLIDNPVTSLWHEIMPIAQDNKAMAE